MQPLADVHQPVLAAAGQHQQLQLSRRGGRIGHEIGRRPRVRRRREPADPGEAIEVREAEVQGLPAAHRQPGEGAALPIRLHRIARLRSPGSRRRTGRARRPRTPARWRRRCSPGAVVLLRAPVREHGDERHHLAVGDQVVEQDVADWRSGSTPSRRRRCRAAGRRRDTSCPCCSPAACRRSSCAACRPSSSRTRSAPARRAGSLRAARRSRRALPGRRARRRAGGRRAATCAPAPPGPDCAAGAAGWLGAARFGAGRSLGGRERRYRHGDTQSEFDQSSHHIDLQTKSVATPSARPDRSARCGCR